MAHVDMPQVGSITRAAEYLLEKSQEVHDFVHSEFNGFPIHASQTDTPALIVMRWNYDRILIQIANGQINVHNVVDPRYLNRR